MQPARSSWSLQATEHDVVDALCLSAPVARRVKLPEAGQRQDHVVGVEAWAERSGGDVRLKQAVKGCDDRGVGAWLFAERNLYVDWIETRPSAP